MKEVGGGGGGGLWHHTRIGRERDRVEERFDMKLGTGEREEGMLWWAGGGGGVALASCTK